ncbi:MAG: DNA-binding protein [Candidatus Woesearchaeota archaeon]|jgi:programmed cell death protein 5|nr:DNA-binding protein [Candidatus Woesearchaeota archaeon]|tara:strand:- start:1090 stop:1407 length:318 start_codon:yes stop_codon:yes gene_type:complete
MDELEEIKKRKLEELKQQQGSGQQDEEVQQQIHQLEGIVKQAFTKEALERYGNLKTAHPDKAVQVLAILGQAISSGQITKIDDTQFKELLTRLTPEKKEFKITRK